MSYCRFLEGDVYLYMHVGGWLECCWCLLGHDDFENFRAKDTQTMIKHLKKHEASGHRFPARVYDQLKQDDQENFGTT